MKRIIWVLLGLLYMYTLVGFSREAFGFSMPIAIAAVLGTLFLLTYLLSILCVRFSKTSGDDRRFQLSTILLVMCYLSVYLAFFRALINSIEQSEGKIGVESWFQAIMLLVVAFFFFLFNTFVLLHMGEAVMFALNQCVKYSARIKKQG